MGFYTDHIYKELCLILLLLDPKSGAPFRLGARGKLLPLPRPPLGGSAGTLSVTGEEYWSTKAMALGISVKNSALFACEYLVNVYGVAAAARFPSLLGWAP